MYFKFDSGQCPSLANPFRRLNLNLSFPKVQLQSQLFDFHVPSTPVLTEVSQITGKYLSSRPNLISNYMLFDHQSLYLQWEFLEGGDCSLCTFQPAWVRTLNCLLHSYLILGKLSTSMNVCHNNKHLEGLEKHEVKMKCGKWPVTATYHMSTIHHQYSHPLWKQMHHKHSCRWQTHHPGWHILAGVPKVIPTAIPAVIIPSTRNAIQEIRRHCLVGGQLWPVTAKDKHKWTSLHYRADSCWRYH